MTIWKQKYEVTFTLTEDIKLEILLSFDNQEEKTREELLEVAKNAILVRTDIDVTGKDYLIEEVALINDVLDEDYILAKHLYRQEIELGVFEPEHEEIFDKAIEETGVDFNNSDLEETTRILNMLYVYFYPEEII
jgi:hypothetical protein